MLLPIELPPGVMANGTEYEAKGRWRIADLIRWYEGHMQPIGGWQRFSANPLAAPARGICAWRDNIGVRRAAFGTASNLYVADGSAVTDITPSGLASGMVDQSAGGGFGAGVYSSGYAYGVPPVGAGLETDATYWSLDSFGEILLGLSNVDGRLCYWAPNATPAQSTAAFVSGAPTNAQAMFVTDERMAVLLGAGGNPREVAWCNQGDYTNWTASATTTAGDLQLQSNGRVRAGWKIGGGQNLVLTDADAHLMAYEGYPYIYGARRIGVGCGIIAPRAFAAVGNLSVWMGKKSFWMYNGAVNALPCDVADAIFNNLNTQQTSKICMGVNAQFNEIWVFFPSLSSTENDSYAFWNFRDNYWGVGLGVLGRTSWVDQEVWDYPLACGADANLYEHENGWTDAGMPRTNVSAESGPYELTFPLGFNNGDAIANVGQIVSDAYSGGGVVQLGFTGRFTPNGQKYTFGPYTMRSDGYTDARFCGRQITMQVQQTTDGLWHVGNVRVDATPGSRR